MKKKLMILLISLVMGTTILTGCSQPNKDVANKESSTDQEANKDVSSAESNVAEEDNKVMDETTEAIEKTEVNVFVAASLKNAVTEIIDNYNEIHPEVVFVLNADSTGKLQKQVEEGATCDVFFSAAVTQIDNLEKGGYIDSGSITNLVENKVVLIKAKGTDTDVTGFNDITKAENIALAGESVPVGSYARQILTNIGNIDEVMKMDVNEVTKVTEALIAVNEGSNEIGIVYATDAASMKDTIEVIEEAPEESLDEKVVYPIAKIEDSEENEMVDKCANEFLEYIKSDAGLEVLESYGFKRYSE